MPNLNKFFEACGIPQYVWKNAQEDSKIEPAEVKWLNIQLLNRPLVHGGLVIRLNHCIGKKTNFRLDLRN